MDLLNAVIVIWMNPDSNLCLLTEATKHPATAPDAIVTFDLKSYVRMEEGVKETLGPRWRVISDANEPR